MWNFLLFFILSLSAEMVWANPSTEGVEWVKEALDLVGEREDPRVEVIEKLRQRPEFESHLRSELKGPRRSLALDVIATLKLKSLFSDVLKMASEDASGMAYLTVNTFVHQNNREEISQLYIRRWRDPQTSLASRLVLLDSLTRMKKWLPYDELKDRFYQSEYEEQSAILRSLRQSLIATKNPQRLVLVNEALKSPYFQIQIQALFLLKEIRAHLHIPEKILPSACNEFLNPEVYAVCYQLYEQPDKKQEATQ